MILIHNGETPITEEIVASLAKKYMYATENYQMTQDENGVMEEVNAWFGGFVYGYEKAILHFDYMSNLAFAEPQTYFNLLLSDGMSYVLSPKKCVLYELTEEEFNEKSAEHKAKQIMEGEPIDVL